MQERFLKLRNLILYSINKKERRKLKSQKTKLRLSPPNTPLGVIERIIGISFGSMLMAISINALIAPYGLLSGGISGLALLTKYVFNLPIPLGIFLFNVPIFIWGIKCLSKSFLVYSFVGIITLIIALPLTKPFIPIPDLDLILVSISSGIVNGIGGGIIFKYGGSPGGTSIIAMIMKKKRNISIGSFSFYSNALILALSLFFFDLKITLYTAVSIWISGKMNDYVIDGINRNKSVIIISDKSAEIAMHIMKDLHRGVTYLEGCGAFSGCHKSVINCVVSNYEIAKLREIVANLDQQAFMFITDVTEVSGKGFTWG
ncbi:MAG TPA: YitT family protein [Clostridia bacterium]|nr:YitT family protein [Clostridia bacterium]